MNRILPFILFFSLFLVGCSSSDDHSGGNNNEGNLDFDRKPMLENWANNIIMPAFANYESKLENMGQAIQDFESNKTVENLKSLREAHKAAYIAWQKCSFFEVGPAKDENLRLFTNTYPTNPQKTVELSLQQDYKLNLISNNNKQGLPALDYLINGFAANDNEIVNKYSGANGEQYTKFLKALNNRLLTITKKVTSTWKNDYKNIFIKNSGSSASSSVDLIANDYLLYYEKFMRNGKVRFPVGLSNNTPNPEIVEAYYSPSLSKVLLKTSVEALRDFYEGKSFNSNDNGLGFKDYLIKLKKEEITNTVDANFQDILSKINGLGNNLSSEVVNNRPAVLSLHDAIQNNVKNLKIDMLQTMGIVVAYVDGDGD